MDERLAQILTLGGRLREARYTDISNIPDFLVRLNDVWPVSESLGHLRSDYMKKTSLLLASGMPSLISSLISRRDQE